MGQVLELLVGGVAWLLAGAEMITFFAPPASMWTRAFSASVKRPVDSTTMSTPRSRHFRPAGSRSLRNRTGRSPTRIVPSLALTGGPKVPRAESCFRRWAKVGASPMSLTATISTSGLSWLAAR